MQRFSKRMGARSDGTERPPGSPSVQGLAPAVVNTVVRRLGAVALAAHDTMMSNLISAGNEALAEALNDQLKPLVDCLLHFELEEITEVDHGIPSTDR